MSAKVNPFSYLFISLIFFHVPSSHQQSCNSQDQSSLLAFDALISTALSFPPLNWSSSITCCSWEGVDCDANGSVFALQLHSRGIEGRISSSIQNLVRLTHLDLSKNFLSGTLPIGLFESLSILEIVDLSFNQLDGDFSSSLSSQGGLPTTIRTVNIASNNFHGVMESSMFLGASNLSSFNSSKNSFSGVFPSSICINSPLLKALDFSYNSFNGVLPTDIGECSKLVSLILRQNKLEGDLSKLNFSKLSVLKKLDLSRNIFRGTLPESLYSCKSMVALRVASNIYLTGQISPKIERLKSLSFLSLTNNSFTNITSALGILAGCKNLTTLFLGYNFYGETLPSNRSFIGSNGFPSLQFLSLKSSNLSGYFPEWISNTKSLRILQLGENRITGTIPKWIGALPKLFALELSNNLLTGEIPVELCLLPALVSANVSTLNHLYIDLPVFSIFPSRRTWDQIIVYPPQLCLKNNRISGKIPSEIGKLQNLHMLYLNGNNLSGEIPVQVSNLKNLEQLSLAQNHLTGEIPESLRGLTFLSIFNVSYNDLQGPIPTGGQFDTFQASSYEGNPGLCGEALQRRCNFEQHDQPDSNDESDSYGSRSFLDGLTVGFALGFSVILAFVASSVWYKNLYLLICNKLPT